MAKKFEVQTRQHTRTDYIISIWDDIEEYDEYDKLFETLNKITDQDNVTLNVSSNGGRCDVGFTIYDRIKSLPCQVDVIVPYPAYSMGALLALSGDSLHLNDGAYIMFHDYSTGTRGKGNEIFKQTEAYKKAFETMFNSVCQPFLTRKECEDVLNGRDLYVNWYDDNLEKRIKRHFPN